MRLDCGVDIAFCGLRLHKGGGLQAAHPAACWGRWCQPKRNLAQDEPRVQDLRPACPTAGRQNQCSQFIHSVECASLPCCSLAQMHCISDLNGFAVEIDHTNRWVSVVRHLLRLCYHIPIPEALSVRPQGREHNGNGYQERGSEAGSAATESTPSKSLTSVPASHGGGEQVLNGLKGMSGLS